MIKLLEPTLPIRDISLKMQECQKIVLKRFMDWDMAIQIVNLPNYLTSNLVRD